MEWSKINEMYAQHFLLSFFFLSFFLSTFVFYLQFNQHSTFEHTICFCLLVFPRLFLLHFKLFILFGLHLWKPGAMVFKNGYLKPLSLFFTPQSFVFKSDFSPKHTHTLSHSLSHFFFSFYKLLGGQQYISSDVSPEVLRCNK